MGKIATQITNLEKASRGEDVRKALLDFINRVNIYHSNKFGTEKEPSDINAYKVTEE